MTFATSKNVLSINVQYKDLYAYNILQRCFISDEGLSNDELIVRYWLTENIISAFKVYENILSLILQHEKQDQVQQGNLNLYLLEIPMYLESLISIVKRICEGVKVISTKNEVFKSVIEKHQDAIKKVSEIRNKFEHFNKQLNNEKLTTGAVNIIFSEEGKYIAFRKNKILTVDLILLMEGVFDAVSSLHSGFQKSNKSQSGILSLTISGSSKIITHKK